MYVYIHILYIYIYVKYNFTYLYMLWSTQLNQVRISPYLLRRMRVCLTKIKHISLVCCFCLSSGCTSTAASK